MKPKEYSKVDFWTQQALKISLINPEKILISNNRHFSLKKVLNNA